MSCSVALLSCPNTNTERGVIHAVLHGITAPTDLTCQDTDVISTSAKEVGGDEGSISVVFRSTPAATGVGSKRRTTDVPSRGIARMASESRVP